MFTLFVDSDCDITKKQAEEYGAKFISMPYIEDEKEIAPYVDWKDFNDHEYYDKMRKGKLFSTCGLSPEQYRKYFEPEFKAGKDILYVHFSAAMTSSFYAMNIALAELQAEYPDRKFYEVDTKGITIVSFSQVIEVLEMYKAGKDIEEIYKKATEEVEHFACYFYADNLKFFAKSGRVSGIAAFMGNLIGIKPVITMNSEGKMVPYSKIRGRNNAIKEIVNMVVKLQDHIEDHYITIAHCDCPELMAKLKAEIQAAIKKDLKFIEIPVNPTAGAHCGPDTVGVSFHSISR